MKPYLTAALVAAFVAAFSFLAYAQVTGSPSWLASGPATGNGYPQGAQPFTASGTGTTSATVTVTAVAGKITYVCGVAASENAGTAATAAGSITNLLGPALTAITASFWYSRGVITASANASHVQTFSPCVPAVAGQNVVVTSPTATGATASAVFVTGYLF